MAGDDEQLSFDLGPPSETPTEDERPAPITVWPTSSTNPKRPRTKGAGYDPVQRKLTVVFRDGTFYNYYEVSPLEWTNFSRAFSKGVFILAFLDGKRRGEASTYGFESDGHDQMELPYGSLENPQIRLQAGMPDNPPKISRGAKTFINKIGANVTEGKQAPTFDAKYGEGAYQALMKARRTRPNLSPAEVRQILNIKRGGTAYKRINKGNSDG